MMIVRYLRLYLYKRWAVIRRDFRKLWRHYLLQSLLAAVVVAAVLLLLTAEYAVVIASLGSTAFIVFTMPGNPSAKPISLPYSLRRVTLNPYTRHLIIIWMLVRSVKMEQGNPDRTHL